jgi:CRP-like cAMP-binding protein
MANPLVLKLEHGAKLSDGAKTGLAELIVDRTEFAARRDLIAEGEAPAHVHLVLEGFACRYKLLPDGGRQIIAWLVPGDFCDLHVSLLGEMDHNLATLSASTICLLPRHGLERLAEAHPSLTRALWWATLVDEAVLREWLVNMGRRPAPQRIAHMFCEVLTRLQAVELAPGGRIDFPLTRADLADTAGLSTVHVNRVVQDLRDRRLIAWKGRALAVLDAAGLEAFAGFDPNYLHLQRSPNPRPGAGWIA